MTTISGNELLHDIQNSIKRFCILSSEHEYVAVTLWCVYTHFADAFHYAPRLIARSPHKRSGKTRLLEIVAELVRGPLRSVNMTTASMFRVLDRNPHQTLILDEVDALFGTAVKAAQNEDLRALLNAGFQRGNPVFRIVGKDNIPTAFNIFAPAAMAGIGKLPDTIEDRSLVIPMRRKSPDESVQPFRPNRDAPGLHALRDRVVEWAEEAGAHAELYATDQTVDLPVDDRAADLWEPLLIVAALAGSDWLDAGRAACRAMVARANDDDITPGQQLLADIRSVLVADFVSSADLCIRLRRLPESPWNDENLTTHRLAHMLSEYGIKPKHSHDKSRRGYYSKDFVDAWGRYLPERVSKVSQASDTHADQTKRRDGLTTPDASQVSPDGCKVSGEPELSQQSRRSNPVPDTSDTSDALFTICPNCRRTTTTPGKCGACIAAKYNAASKTTQETAS